MKKILLMAIITITLLSTIVAIVTAHEINITEAKKIIDSEINCSKLDEGELEAIGEYYMEQIHPGEAHELMDKMMGGEDSESLRKMHINMAKTIYCNESGMMGSGEMMGMMNMMDGGMMGSGEMMGNSGSGFNSWNFINILYAILLVGLIVLVSFFIIKLWKNINKQKTERGSR